MFGLRTFIFRLSLGKDIKAWPQDRVLPPDPLTLAFVFEKDKLKPWLVKPLRKQWSMF
jgi:hypothetical protein